MKYDFVKDTMTIDGKDYPLRDFRKWLIINHEELVKGHFIKAIKVMDYTKFTYDWQTIYFKASEYGLLTDYLKTLK